MDISETVLRIKSCTIDDFVKFLKFPPSRNFSHIPENLRGGLFGNCAGIYGRNIKIKGDVSYIRGDADRLTGIVSGICGNVNNISGNVTGVYGQINENLYGNLNSIIGDISNISGFIGPDLIGDVTNISGDISKVKGNVDKRVHERFFNPNFYLHPTDLFEFLVSFDDNGGYKIDHVKV